MSYLVLMIISCLTFINANEDYTNVFERANQTFAHFENSGKDSIRCVVRASATGICGPGEVKLFKTDDGFSYVGPDGKRYNKFKLNNISNPETSAQHTLPYAQEHMLTLAPGEQVDIQLNQLSRFLGITNILGLSNPKSNLKWQITEKGLEIIFENLRTVDLISNVKKPKLAFISPLPPEQSGISDYSAEFLPELLKHYDIDVVINQQTVSESWIHQNCNIYNVQQFEEIYQTYDRILYHFGNSQFHTHMFDLLEKTSGVVVLHDFFLSGAIHYMEKHMAKSNFHLNKLRQEYGDEAVYDYQHYSAMEITQKYPCSKQVFDQSLGVIMHSEHGKRLAHQFYQKSNIQIIKLLRIPSDISSDRTELRKIMGFSHETTIISSFGIIQPSKLNHRLFDAFINSNLNQKDCILVFVGLGVDHYMNEIKQKASNYGLSSKVMFTGHVDTQRYKAFLTISDIAVQLRTHSRGETSAAVLDTMNYGIPTIINKEGSLEELPDNSVLKISTDFTDDELIKALDILYSDMNYRKALGDQARKTILSAHNPAACAYQYFETIEGFYRK